MPISADALPASIQPAGSLAPEAIKKRAERLLDALVGFWIFSGGFVMIEPSPYELTFVMLLPVAVMAGLGLYRSTFGLLAIIIAFTPFALIAAFQVRYTEITNAMIFTIITIFLMVTSYFAANYVAEDTERRFRLIMRAYTIAAVICALIGILAYLRLMPGADLFTRYGRAKSTFKDPNVYGPFLVLPAMYALQRVLFGKKANQWRDGLIYLVLFVGAFVSFSRGAWLHFAGSSAAVVFLCFYLEANGRERVRIMLMTLVGAGMLVVALAGLLSIPAVSKLFETRTQSQLYDTGDTGRIGRQGYAFDLALSNPLGMGPLQFEHLKIAEAPHNLYVTVLHHYGWGGGLMFYILIVSTLWRGVASLSRPSPYRLVMIPLMATFGVVAAESIIIDSDHWRHFFLLAGLIWGVSTAITNAPRTAGPRRRVLI